MNVTGEHTLIVQYDRAGGNLNVTLVHLASRGCSACEHTCMLGTHDTKYMYV